jgi:hypothetical protein
MGALYWAGLLIIAWPVRQLPEWMPGMSFKKTAREWKTQVDRVWDAPIATVKTQMVSDLTADLP